MSRIFCILVVLMAMPLFPVHAALSAESHSHAAVRTLNGQELPVGMRKLQDVKMMLNATDTTGNRVYVTMGTRKAGTRAAIHTHPFGGHTCVLSGEITAYIEGQEPSKQAAGSCYLMPPNVPMAAVNLGREDAVLIDTFILPPGVDEIMLLEDYPED